MLYAMLLCVFIVALWTSATVERAAARFVNRRVFMRYPLAVASCTTFLAFYFS